MRWRLPVAAFGAVVAGLAVTLALAQGRRVSVGAPDAFTGAAAGGDLAGTYPNPTLGAGVVDGTELANTITTDAAMLFDAAAAAHTFTFQAGGNVGTAFVVEDEGGRNILQIDTGVGDAIPDFIIGNATEAGTLQFDFTGVADFAPASGVNLPAASVDATEITDITRSVNLPISSFEACGTVDDSLGLNFDDAVDTFPDFARGSGGGTVGSLAIQWDRTVDSVDIEYVCTQIVVPADYVSGGIFRFAYLDTATNDHLWDVNTLVVAAAGTAIEDVVTADATLAAGPGATAGCNGCSTASAVCFCDATPEALVAGDVVTLSIDQLVASDAGTIFGMSFRYTATQ